MKHITTATILSIILVGTLASIAAIKDKSPASIPDLEGKIVIPETENSWPPIENVKLGVIGDRQFIVLPMKRDDGTSFDRWIQLESVYGFKVFDKMEDAVKYLKN